MIRSETNEKMDLEGHYPQNTISHGIVSNETQITLHFFQARISSMPVIRADFFMAISDTGICLLTLSFFKCFTSLVPSWPRFENILLNKSLARINKNYLSKWFKVIKYLLK